MASFFIDISQPILYKVIPICYNKGARQNFIQTGIFQSRHGYFYLGKNTNALFRHTHAYALVLKFCLATLSVVYFSVRNICCALFLYSYLYLSHFVHFYYKISIKLALVCKLFLQYGAIWVILT